jgi:hypothetical protein
MERQAMAAQQTLDFIALFEDLVGHIPLDSIEFYAGLDQESIKPITADIVGQDFETQGMEVMINFHN